MPIRKPVHVETPWDERWNTFEGDRIVFLLDAASNLEKRLLCRWIERASRTRPTPDRIICETIRIPSSRRPRRRDKTPSSLEARIQRKDDPLFAPLRVAWLPKERAGIRTARLTDLLLFGDPRDPGPLRQRIISFFFPDRFQILVGDPASLSSLRQRWEKANDPVTSETLPLAEFIMNQAALTLERAERTLRGTRYKVPRFVAKNILSSSSFQHDLARLAHQHALDLRAVRRQAVRNLREIAATHSSFAIDLVAQLIHFIYTLGYSERLRYDRAKLVEIAKLSERNSLVFLPSHKSNLDHLVLQYALYENGLPPNHSAGGINMNFFPVGALLRRAGIFFIRRSFKSDEVYKFVLRRYIEYLIDKRFSLEWYIEGSRSRSGKLLFPRFGLLHYAAQAIRQHKGGDVILVPVSIAYDQIQEVGEYVTEQRGGKKERQSFGWLIQTIQKLESRRGDIHISFGELISLRQELATRPSNGGDSDFLERDPLRKDVERIGFLVAKHINRVTPITPISLVTMAILSAGDRALTLEETAALVADLLDYVKRRKLPTTSSIHLETKAGVRRAIEVLMRSDVLSCYAEGSVSVYAVGPDQHLTAAYYRNTIVHFFVTAAIAEIALLACAEQDGADRLTAFRNEALRLRELLRFEFIFEDQDIFVHQLEAELALQDPNWKNRMQVYAVTETKAQHPSRQLLRRIRPLISPHVLGPIFEAYRIVADALEQADASKDFDQSNLLSSCQGLGKQYLLQRRIRNPEAISKSLFESALQLAEYRGLLTNSPDLEKQRREFAATIRQILRHINAVAALAASLQAGFED